MANHLLVADGCSCDASLCERCARNPAETVSGVCSFCADELVLSWLGRYRAQGGDWQSLMYELDSQVIDEEMHEYLSTLEDQGLLLAAWMIAR